MIIYLNLCYVLQCTVVLYRLYACYLNASREIEAQNINILSLLLFKAFCTSLLKYLKVCYPKTFCLSAQMINVWEERLVRKLRKKLRQIEVLDNLNRPLNEEELAKVGTKQEIQAELERMKRRSEELECAEAAVAEGDNQGEGSPPKRRRSASTGEDSVQQKSSRRQEVQNEEPSSSTDRELSTSAPATSSQHKLWRCCSDAAISSTLLVPSHDDLSLSADCDVRRDVAVTAGRDTTVLVWRLSTAERVASLGGHTGPVSTVVILPEACNAAFNKVEKKDVLAVSGSADCSLKVWNALTGAMVASVYTYNGVRCSTPLPACKDGNPVVLMGTDGGKLEAFDLARGKAVHADKAHEDAVTAVHARDGRVVSASRDGIIKVWQINPSSTPLLRCLFVSESLQTAEPGQSAHLRCVLSARLLPNAKGDDCDASLVAFGDAGSNLKVLDWKRGLLHKVPNHTSDMGFTDSIRTVGDSLLLASSYHLDSGRGSINLFKLQSSESGLLPEYLCSWSDDRAGRILSLAASFSDGDGLSVVTVGKEVTRWRAVNRENRDDEASSRALFSPTVLPLSNAAVDSGSSDEENEEDEENIVVSEETSNNLASSDGLTSRCTIL